MSASQTERRRHQAGTNRRESHQNDVTINSSNLIDDAKAFDCVNHIYKAIEQLQILSDYQSSLDVRLSRLHTTELHHMGIMTTHSIRYQGACNVIGLYI